MADMKKEEMEDAEDEMDDVEEPKMDAATTDFTVRKAELMADVKVGGYGMILLPVRVLDIGNGLVRLQKNGEAKVEGEFTDSEPLESMKKRLGVAEDR